MHYFSNKFSKIAKRCVRSPLIFNFGEQKLRNLTKLCFFKLMMTIEIQKSNYDVILVT